MTARRHRVSPDRIAARVGKRVKALREAHGIPFSELADESGLGRGYVSELERGLVVPTVGTLARIAAALGVTTADLVAGDGDRETIFELLRLHPEATGDAIVMLENLLAKRTKAHRDR